MEGKQIKVHIIIGILTFILPYLGISFVKNNFSDWTEGMRWAFIILFVFGQFFHISYNMSKVK